VDVSNDRSASRYRPQPQQHLDAARPAGEIALPAPGGQNKRKRQLRGGRDAREQLVTGKAKSQYYYIPADLIVNLVLMICR
jgi:hypothetical protein